MDRLGRDWNTLLGMKSSKSSEGSVVENWVLVVDRLIRDWNMLLVGIKGSCLKCSEGSQVENWVLMDRVVRD